MTWRRSSRRGFFLLGKCSPLRAGRISKDTKLEPVSLGRDISAIDIYFEKQFEICSL